MTTSYRYSPLIHCFKSILYSYISKETTLTHSGRLYCANSNATRPRTVHNVYIWLRKKAHEIIPDLEVVSFYHCQFRKFKAILYILMFMC